MGYRYRFGNMNGRKGLLYSFVCGQTMLFPGIIRFLTIPFQLCRYVILLAIIPCVGCEKSACTYNIPSFILPEAIS